MVWAVDLGVQITDVGRNLHIGSFCPARTSLSRYLEEAGLRRKLGRPNLRWTDAVLQDMPNLKIRNWWSVSRNREG